MPNNYLASPGKLGDIRKDLREPVSPTMKAMHDRLNDANGEKKQSSMFFISIFLVIEAYLSYVQYQKRRRTTVLQILEGRERKAFKKYYNEYSRGETLRKYVHLIQIICKH